MERMVPLEVLKFGLVTCLVCSSLNLVTSTSNPTFFDRNCYTDVGNYTENSTYQKNVNLILSKLTEQSSVSFFYNITMGEGLDKVYGLFYCRGDILIPECHACIQDAAVLVVQKCPIEKEAVIWYEECTLHYANRSIFSSEEVKPWGYYNSPNNVSISADGFEKILLPTMGGLVKKAAYKSARGFATGEANITALQKIYCLVQCSPDILGAPCETCLDAALRDMPSCCGVGRVWTMIYQPSCQLRYDLAPFYVVDSATSLSIQNSSPSQGKQGISLIFGVAATVVLGIVLILGGVSWFLYHMKMKRRQIGLGALSVRTFTYERLANATDGFSTARLLGQGGFGHVYKGVLPDNRVVAIKKLKEGSFQGEREFLSEIEIISRVHHRNLVSLVGYCISGARKLLVYEFVKNNSLDSHLHGNSAGSDSLLDWGTRKRIAVGAAKGLAYLHEDCLPRIIHRDIKSNNILLDSNFEAKVADFGLARIFTDSNTHITTDVKGTPGYLAPEYQTSGMLTEKSDVFSFGIVLLELITGRKPTYLLDWARPLLAQALKDGNLEPLADPKLKNGYVYEDMTRMVVCAALCVHSSADRRLKMSQVVQLLEGILSVDSFAENAQMSANESTVSTLNPHRLDLDDLRRWAFGMQEQTASSGGLTWSTSENTPHAPEISHISLQISSDVITSSDLYPNKL